MRGGTLFLLLCQGFIYAILFLLAAGCWIEPDESSHLHFNSIQQQRRRQQAKKLYRKSKSRVDESRAVAAETFVRSQC
jgi:hypothetical protein